MKYLISYLGPGYASLDHSDMEGFQTLYDIMQSMRERQRGADTVFVYEEDAFGIYRPHEGLWDKYMHFPTSTREDYMDVYYAIPEDGGYVLGNWAYRVTVGPRGGIRVDKT